MSGHVATAQCEIDAPPEQVWRALTDRELIKQYMFGSEVETDWKPGSPITWQGEFEGRPYEDKGEIISVEPGRATGGHPLQPAYRPGGSARELPPGPLRPAAYRRRHDGTTNPRQQQQCRGGRALWSQLANDARRPEESRRAAVTARPDQHLSP